MRILVVHNYYASAAPSGENAAVLAETELLRGFGHEVLEFSRHNDVLREGGPAGRVLGALRAGMSVGWNAGARAQLRRRIVGTRPDIVHVHNTFPQLSASVFYACDHGPAALVATLHNYRVFCSAGIAMRQGRTCTDCLERHSTLPALRHGCYRQSRLATAPIAAALALHRRARTLERRVDAIICLTDFQRSLMVQWGLPAERLHVKGGACLGSRHLRPWSERAPSAVFVGRLSAEKGVADLLHAWRAWGAAAPALDIVGDGPERAALERSMAGTALAGIVHFHGQLAPERAQEILGRARLLLLPALSFEGLPMVIVEAFALGVPVAASAIGGIPEVVPDGTAGTLFRPRDPGDMLGRLRQVWERPGELERLGRNARKRYEEHYAPGVNHGRLMDIYESALQNRRTLARVKVA